MRTLKQKVDVEMEDARVGWKVEGVKNAYRSSKSESKTRTVKQKVGFETSKTHTVKQKVRQKCAPSCRNKVLVLNANRPELGI